MNWERVEPHTTDTRSATYRMKTPTGWIVKTEILSKIGAGVSVALTTVDDPYHVWGTY
jgi:hypothetical protein